MWDAIQSSLYGTNGSFMYGNETITRVRITDQELRSILGCLFLVVSNRNEKNNFILRQQYPTTTLNFGSLTGITDQIVPTSQTLSTLLFG